jgi:hypothetical protein
VLKAQAKLVRRVAIRRKALIRELDLMGAALRNGDTVLADDHRKSATTLLTALVSDFKKMEGLETALDSKPSGMLEPLDLKI